MSALPAERVPLPVAAVAIAFGAALFAWGVQPLVHTRRAPSAIAAPAAARDAPPRGPSRARAVLQESPETRAVPTPRGRPVDGSPTGLDRGSSSDCFAPLELRYASGSASAMGAHDLELLGSLADYVTRHPTASVIVAGHTDAVGDERENLWLSRARAQLVARALSQAGVEPERITVRALGEFVPREGGESGSAANRRVEVSVRGVQGCDAGEVW